MEAFGNTKDVGQKFPNKVTNLNPNAAEFVPSSVGLLGGSSSDNAEIKNQDFLGTSWESPPNFPVSSAFNVYDDDYWSHQLPDDISPDFKITGEDNLGMPADLSISGLYINDGIEASSFGSSGGTTNLFHQPQPINADSIRINSSNEYSKSHTLNGFVNVSSNLGDMQIANADQNVASFRENAHCIDPSADFITEQIHADEGTTGASINHVDFLASEFPGFSAESLAELYFANGCDLNLTVEILTQLELQVEVGCKQELGSKPSDHAVSLNPLDFPALPTSSGGNSGVSKCNGEDTKAASDTYQLFDKGSYSLFNLSSSSASSRDASDFASAVRKTPSWDFEHTKNKKNTSTFTSVNPIRNSQNSHSLYIGNGKSVGVDKMQNNGTTSRAIASWLKTGDAVGNMYSESREEARDFARVRNAYFEQARQAYLIGNKALAKELSVKGQLYNMQMKAAHEKAREAIYKQRNPNSPVVQGQVGGKDPLIDLHGLHVTEAIHILKQEISILRRRARSDGYPLQALICVGTGHHTKGSRTPARLPVAVERYLVEEGLHYSEPQPGLFRMVVK